MTERGERRNIVDVKGKSVIAALGEVACAFLAGIALGMLAMLAGCATGPNPKPNPCIGSAKDRETMPCTCPGTLNPACEPWITDTKRPDAGQGADR